MMSPSHLRKKKPQNSSSCNLICHSFIKNTSIKNIKEKKSFLKKRVCQCDYFFSCFHFKYILSNFYSEIVENFILNKMDH